MAAVEYPFLKADPAMPNTSGEAVTPSDTTELTYFSRAIWVGGAGDGTLKVVTRDGTTIAFTGVPAGSYIPLSVKQVFDTGTGVTGIVALY